MAVEGVGDHTAIPTESLEIRTQARFPNSCRCVLLPADKAQEAATGSG